MASFDKHALAPDGSTGNNTHAGLHVGADYDSATVQFQVTAVGATPTVTWKVQGSFDSTNGTDGEWFDMGYVTDASDGFSVATRVRTAVGSDFNFLTRPAKWLRLVTSANTNVTYKASVNLDVGNA